MDQSAPIWKQYLKFLAWATPSLAGWFFAWGFLLPKLEQFWIKLPAFRRDWPFMDDYVIPTRTVIGHFGVGILVIGFLIVGGEVISRRKPDFRRPFLAILAWFINGLVILALIVFIMWAILAVGMVPD